MRINTTKLVGILLAVIAVALLASSAVIFTFTRCSSSNDKKDSTADSSPTTEATTLPVTPDKANSVSTANQAESADGASSHTINDSSSVSDASSGATEPEEAKVSAELSALLEQGGHSAENLKSIGAGQLIIVNSSGTSAEISFFENNEKGWEKADSLNCSGYVGVEGTVYEMSEQVSGTPKGLYPVGSAFFQGSAPETGLDSFAITSETYWVDDPDSAYYNQKVVGEENRDWNSAEHMNDISGYRYGFVINYNMPAEYNKGSAIFFHIGSSPTQGCVATSEDMVLAYLAKLSAAKNPYILII